LLSLIASTAYLTTGSPKKKEPAMRPVLLLSMIALIVALPALGVAEPVKCMVDGSSAMVDPIDLPANTGQDTEGRTVDVVGDNSNSNSAASLAKGNSYRIDTSVTLDEAEFRLSFTGTQTLTYYVFVCPTEFGTYTEVYRDSEVVSGMGTGWYSSGTIAVPLNAGSHYIIAVSWNGFLTYYYDTGDTQDTSFGAYVHGYATGADPLPASFDSSVNDQAIYYQRLNTTTFSPVEDVTWGGIKALYR
jgi:hypothetical protein